MITQQPHHTDTDTPPTERRRHPAAAIARWAWMILTTIVSAACLLSAIGSDINPIVWAVPAIMAMAFPFCFGANLVCGLINLWVWRRASIVQWTVMIASAGAFFDFCPINVLRSDPTAEQLESEATFKLMSYNTLDYVDTEEIYPENTNRTVSAIIHSGADIVCLQEATGVSPIPGSHLYEAQCDSIHRIYPYSVHKSGLEFDKQLVIMSKYPLKAIDFEQPTSNPAGYQGALVDIDGTEILIVSVHLQSIGLDVDDRETFQRITEANTDVDIKDAAKVFYSKLTTAFKLRSAQTQGLADQIKTSGYTNVIIAGDFNDINNCYAIKVLRSQLGMSSAFNTIHTGPIITYHANHFFFNIDHILYTKQLKCIDYSRGNIKSSDHYPIFATFTIKPDAAE